ncbi:MAG: dTMP kinase, partial [Polyangiaceae bacterium]
ATLNKQARRPDLTIVLDVPADVAAARRQARGEPAQLYEQNEVQRQLAVFYKNLMRYLPKDRIVLVDATSGVDQVADRIFAAYEERFH